MVVLVIMGVCGCGKTTVGQALARKVGCPFADADDLHPKSNVDKMRHGIPLTDQDRLPWLKSLHCLIKDWEIKLIECETNNFDDVEVTREDKDKKKEEERTMREDDDAIEDNSLALLAIKLGGVLACSALKHSYRDILIGGGGSDAYYVDCIFVVLCGQEATILARLENRQEHYMPPSLLRSQLDTLEVPAEDEGKGRILIQDLEKPVDDLVSLIVQQLLSLLESKLSN